MKRAIVGVLLGVLVTSVACAQKQDGAVKKAPTVPKVTREFLLAHGFRVLADDPATFIRERVPLTDVLRDLDIPLTSLRPMVSQPADSDMRAARVHGISALFQSEVRDREGRIVEHSLDMTDSICTVHVCLMPERKYLKTDSSPRLHIKSVAVPKDHSQPLQVTFELSADGKKPVAILQRDFYVELTGGNIPPCTGFGYSLPEGTPQTIVVSPDKPIALKYCIPVDVVGRLSAGEYAVRVQIGGVKGREDQCLDYEWEGVKHSSDTYKFVIK